jgi:hypothetical protein
MVTIKKFINAISFKIDEGCEYLWECYGPDCRQLGWIKPDRSATAGIVYDIKSHVVYEMSVWDDKNNEVWRWIKPGFRKAHDSESWSRGFDPKVAIDKTKFQDLSPRPILDRLKKVHRRRNGRT